MFSGVFGQLRDTTGHKGYTCITTVHEGKWEFWCNKAFAGAFMSAEEMKGRQVLPLVLHTR